MLKKCLFISCLLAANIAWAAAGSSAYKEGYWYNDTDDNISIHEAALPPISLEPHTLVEMKKIRFFKGKSGNRYSNYHYKKESLQGEGDEFHLNWDLVGRYGSEYVIVFKNDPAANASGLKFSVVPEKEFRDKYAKELEAYPVPGPLQRIIGSFTLPSKAVEKRQTIEE